MLVMRWWSVTVGKERGTVAGSLFGCDMNSSCRFTASKPTALQSHSGKSHLELPVNLDQHYCGRAQQPSRVHIEFFFPTFSKSAPSQIMHRFTSAAVAPQSRRLFRSVVVVLGQTADAVTVVFLHSFRVSTSVVVPFVAVSNDVEVKVQVAVVEGASG